MLKRNIVALVCLALSAVIGAGSFVYVSTLKHKTNTIHAELAEQQGNVDVMDEDEEDVSGLNPEDFLKAATESGNQVIDLQAQYAKSAKSVATLEGDALDKALLEQKELVAETKTHFKEGVSMPPLWYEGNNYNMTATWSFADNYEFTKSSVDCLWICKDEENRILAYATAVYDARIDLFDKLKITTTSYGHSKMGVTLENGVTESGAYDDKVTKEYTDSIQDMANQNNVGPSHSLTEEEKSDRADAFSAREQLREEYEKQQSKGGAN